MDLSRDAKLELLNKFKIDIDNMLDIDQIYETKHVIVFVGAFNLEPVAIKLLKRGDQPLEGELGEWISWWYAMSHPNICRFRGVFDKVDPPYAGLFLVSDYHSKGDLCRNLSTANRANMPYSTRLRFLFEISSALVHIHTLPNPIVHNDLKPANILLAQRYSYGDVEDYDSYSAVLSDFGGCSLNSHPIKYYSPHYSEVLTANSRASPSRDVFALGQIAYEMFSTPGDVEWDCAKHGMYDSIGFVDKKFLSELRTCSSWMQKADESIAVDLQNGLWALVLDILQRKLVLATDLQYRLYVLWLQSHLVDKIAVDYWLGIHTLKIARPIRVLYTQTMKLWEVLDVVGCFSSPYVEADMLSVAYIVTSRIASTLEPCNEMRRGSAFMMRTVTCAEFSRVIQILMPIDTEMKDAPARIKSFIETPGFFGHESTSSSKNLVLNEVFYFLLHGNHFDARRRSLNQNFVTVDPLKIKERVVFYLLRFSTTKSSVFLTLSFGWKGDDYASKQEPMFKNARIVKMADGTYKMSSYVTSRSQAKTEIIGHELKALLLEFSRSFCASMGVSYYFLPLMKNQEGSTFTDELVGASRAGGLGGSYLRD